MKKLLVILCMTLFLGITGVAKAGLIQPVTYNMLNGGSGLYNYWDDSYDGSGNKTEDYASLSGGVGDLTDGTIATDNWRDVEGPKGPNGPYVGWDKNYLIDPTITFNFGQIVNIDSITFYVDDADGDGGVSVPDSFDIAGNKFSVNDPSGSEPTSYNFSGLNLNVSSLSITINHRDQWVMLSEVQFEAVPIPGAVWLLGSGLIGIVGIRRKLKN